MASRARLAAALAVLAAAAGAAHLLIGAGSGDDAPGLAEAAAEAGREDSAFRWDPERQEELEERAATGTSHVLYALSPGGVLATAERVGTLRPEIERAAERHGVAAGRLEALVFLESAGRPEVIAGETPEAASGLGQILPSTATDLLGMEVDLERSIELTREAVKQARKGEAEKAQKLLRERARVDERFQVEAALDGAARYLEIAQRRFGAEDLATVSYHMGIGNLESVMAAYGEEQVSYAQLFFDSSPSRNPEAWDILGGFADDSSLYLWRVLASEEIMRLYRSDRAELERRIGLATAKATLEELYHPEYETEILGGPDDVEAAIADGALLELPRPRDVGEPLGWSADPRMGELAPDLGRGPGLYRALRPEALAVLSYIGGRVAELSGASRPLRVTSTVRDQAYQDLLEETNPEATAAYSLHTTGYAFDVLREYESGAQASAFQFALDRLRALAVIDYAVEPRAIHVTVSPYAAELLAP